MKIKLYFNCTALIHIIEYWDSKTQFARKCINIYFYMFTAFLKLVRNKY